ncbi:hypothetical protein [Corynebacterium sp. HMSC036D02]|uniref:hypothetical protein n=1 Tax=Corynebacterium sp. HMSC036D02 TaxID=1715013 RepID=UPI00143A7810|nr:hypothetical protein [Corynebacterium sp. HMSC036D02]
MQPPKLPHHNTLNRPRAHSSKLTRHRRRQIPLLHQPVMPHKSPHQELIRILINHDETTINKFTGSTLNILPRPGRAHPSQTARMPRSHAGAVHGGVRDEHKIQQLSVVTQVKERIIVPDRQLNLSKIPHLLFLLSLCFGTVG